MSEKESVSAAKRSGFPLSLHFDNQKGAVTKWLIILLQPLFCVFISSFLALL
jgi:hypothetical protein